MSGLRNNDFTFDPISWAPGHFRINWYVLGYSRICVRRQHYEITTLQECCQKLQRTEESIYSYEVPDSQHVGTIRDDRNGTSEQVVDTDSDKSTMRGKCRYGVIIYYLLLTVYNFYFWMLIHEQYIEEYY